VALKPQPSFDPKSFLAKVGEGRSIGEYRINSSLGAAFRGWAAPRGFTTIFLCVLVVIGGGAIIDSEVFSKSLGLGGFMFGLEKDKKAPVDYGFGPGAGIGPARPNLVLGQTPAIHQSTGLAPQAGPGAAPKALPRQVNFQLA
jgi:hypothetical protein